MAYNSSHTGAELDSAVVDLTALLSSGGLGKNIRLQNDFKLQGLSTGASTIDMIYLDTTDKIHLGEGANKMRLHGNVEIGTVTSTATVRSDNLVIQGTAGGVGISVLSADSETVRLDFGDVSGVEQGGIRYINSTDELVLRSNGLKGVGLDSDQNMEVTAGNFEVISGFTSMGISENLTIATGVVTPTRSFIAIDTEAAASSDEVHTINAPSSTRAWLLVTAVNSARTVILEDGVGNLTLAGDFSLDNAGDKILLYWGGVAWVEISRSNNAA